MGRVGDVFRNLGCVGFQSQSSYNFYFIGFWFDGGEYQEVLSCDSSYLGATTRWTGVELVFLIRGLRWVLEMGVCW